MVSHTAVSAASHRIGVKYLIKVIDAGVQRRRANVVIIELFLTSWPDVRDLPEMLNAHYLAGFSTTTGYLDLVSSLSGKLLPGERQLGERDWPFEEFLLVHVFSNLFASRVKKVLIGRKAGFNLLFLSFLHVFGRWTRCWLAKSSISICISARNRFIRCTSNCQCDKQ